VRNKAKVKLIRFNDWMTQAPDIKIDQEDIDSIPEQKPMLWGELKAIREDRLDLYQEEMAILLATKVSTYQKWERCPDLKGACNIPQPLANLVRMYGILPALTAMVLKKPRRI